VTAFPARAEAVVAVAWGCASWAGQGLWPARITCARGGRGSGVQGRPKVGRLRRCAAPWRLEGRPRRLRRTPRPRPLQPGVSGRGGGGVPERGRGDRHCQAPIRVSSSQVGCSQDGAPHLRRASGRSKHSRGSFLPRRASRYTTGLDRDAGCAPEGVSWSSPPTRTRPAPGPGPPPPPPVACRARLSFCTWRAGAAGQSTSGPGSVGSHRPGGGTV
jgi:hypothetical protein